MKGVNRVWVLGRLGGDPELRATTSGKQVATVSVATTERRKNDRGGWDDLTEWHRVVLWDQTADFASKYLRKGDLVSVTGRLQTRTWDKDGEKRYQVEIIASELQGLSSKPKEASEAVDKPVDKPVDKWPRRPVDNFEPQNDDEVPF